MDTDKRFLSSKDVAEITGRKKRTAEQIIHDLNEELEKKGFLTVPGKVINTYFYERYFGKKSNN